MTDIAEGRAPPPTRQATGRRKGTGLDAMVLPELKQLAQSLGVKGTGAMRKSQLIDAIRSAQRVVRPPGPERATARADRDVAAALDDRSAGRGRPRASPPLPASEPNGDGAREPSPGPSGPSRDR